MNAVLVVAPGGAAGSVLGYAVGAALLRSGVAGMPWGMFVVDIMPLARIVET